MNSLVRAPCQADGFLRSSYSIFLVDHAWTYRVEHARQQLEQIPGLLPRMASLMGVDFHGEDPPPDVVELILERMWKYNQTYQLSQGASLRTASHYISLSVSMCFSPLLCCVCVWVCVCVQSAEEKVPVWYIMDEFGSQVQHLDHPSCCMAPFFYMQGQLAYTLLWPLQDLQEGDEVTRDYAYGETNPLLRRCRLLPWIHDDLEGVSSAVTEPADSYYEVRTITLDT
ncbi:tubulin--tyrosine ligase-like protein 12 isoform X6 [Xiphophorus hellerii]|uniref:tubulin--tyrosine ligase-like protein 12 isoform X6 n=1 Tax=Xiphophorus hellerii TaxID=8084 RepID=UPI0013B474F5|nr:tubulin--tyrosine ligase-like protein 12 isoform X6 [Xiphophorus hellerii]